MSEALNSSEIEDVLSSIRRLVSDDLRPLERRSNAGGAASRDGDKLLLTPALRVVQSNPPREQAAPPIDAVVASVSAAVDQQAEEWESETGDLAPVAQDQAHASGDDTAAPMAVDVSEGDWDDHHIDAYAEPLTFVWAPPGPKPEAQDQAERPADATPEASELPGWAQSAGAEEAETEAATPQTHGMAEPDRAWADEAEAAVLQELAAAQTQLDTRADAQPEMRADIRAEAMDMAVDANEPDLPLDEALLREIVRDVLREELQGRLGERITRNIRKLVRAEIARTMASQELL